MLDLFLMRHGKAEHPDRGTLDHDRPLAMRGKDNAASQARALLPAGDHAMLVSTALRTRQTAEILVETWMTLIPKVPSNITVTQQGYLAPAEVWMDLAAMTADSCTGLWIVGHNPGISDLVTRLTGEYIGMATADIVHIGLEAPNWASIAPGCGHILAFRAGRAD